jgi:CBS domain-containing protein
MPQVRDMMVTDVVTTTSSAGIVDAANTMIQQEKGPLPVVDGDRVMGMITDRDIIARVVAAAKDPTSMTVSDVMTTDLFTISPDADESEARQQMAQAQVDRLLVMEGDRLVGIISEADIRRDEGPLA